ncbi:MAG: metal-dependent hydrolase [Magnetococcales bacterium]|nr:metal-dependent hydrolase [Magnetococcales bacterium]
MAGFNVHLAVGAMAGGVGVTSLMVAGLVDSQVGLLGFFAAMIGGVLPDVDAEESIFLDLAFTVFALLGSFFVMFSQTGVYSVAELTILWLVTFLFIKFAVFELFVRFTVHRGIFHSVPAGVFFGGVTAALLIHLFRLPERAAWLAGLFVFFGYLVHLLLDELYSLNLLGEGGVLASFGTAFKFHSRDSWATASMYTAIALVFMMTPGVSGLLGELFSKATLDAVGARFLPAGHWFGLPYWNIPGQ